MSICLDMPLNHYQINNNDKPSQIERAFIFPSSTNSSENTNFPPTRKLNLFFIQKQLQYVLQMIKI